MEAVTFYGKFLKNLSQLTSPMYNLLKKNIEWNWTDECDRNFNTIKEMLTKPPVLAHYDISAPVKLITDASPTGLGAVLVQGREERPIMFISRALAMHERKYPQIEREGLGIVYAVTRLR